MTERDKLRIHQMTKLHPKLSEVDDEQKLRLIRKSQRHPLVWGVFLILLTIWLLLLGPVIMNVSSEKNILILFGKLILPAFLPVVIILFLTIKSQGLVLNKMIHAKK